MEISSKLFTAIVSLTIYFHATSGAIIIINDTKEVMVGASQVGISFELYDVTCSDQVLKIVTPQADCDITRTAGHCFLDDAFQDPGLQCPSKDDRCQICTLVISRVRIEDVGVYALCELKDGQCHQYHNITLNVKEKSPRTTIKPLTPRRLHSLITTLSKSTTRRPSTMASTANTDHTNINGRYQTTLPESNDNTNGRYQTTLPESNDTSPRKAGRVATPVVIVMLFLIVVVGIIFYKKLRRGARPMQLPLPPRDVELGKDEQEPQESTMLTLISETEENCNGNG